LLSLRCIPMQLGAFIEVPIKSLEFGTQISSALVEVTILSSSGDAITDEETCDDPSQTIGKPVNFDISVSENDEMKIQKVSMKFPWDQFEIEIPRIDSSGEANFSKRFLWSEMTESVFKTLMEGYVTLKFEVTGTLKMKKNDQMTTLRPIKKKKGFRCLIM
jgi:hypothetical protein